jgi:hypothetical protein
VIAEDDGNVTQATIRGTAVIGDLTDDLKDASDKTLIAASLLVQPAGQAKPDIYLPIQNVRAAVDSLTFDFPSMRAMRLAKDILAGAAVSLKLDGQTPIVKDTAGNEAGDGSKWSQTYPVRFKPEATDPEPPSFALVQSASVIVADPSTGAGEMRLSLSLKGKTRVKVTIEGADWNDQAGDGSLFTQSQTIIFKLSNLAEGVPVKVTATAVDTDGKALAAKTVVQFSVRNGQRQAQP